MGNQGYFGVYVFLTLHGSNYALWKVRLEGYFIDLDVDVLLSLKYNTYDESNEKSNKIILKTLLYRDVAIVRYCKTKKEIMNKLHCMYGRDGSHIEKPHSILEEYEHIT